MTDPTPPEALTAEDRAVKVAALADGILVRLLKEISDPETKAAPIVAASLDLLRAVSFNWTTFAKVPLRPSAKTPDGLPVFEDSGLPDGVTLSAPLPEQIQGALEATAAQRAAISTPFSVGKI